MLHDEMPVTVEIMKNIFFFFKSTIATIIVKYKVSISRN